MEQELKPGAVVYSRGDWDPTDDARGFDPVDPNDLAYVVLRRGDRLFVVEAEGRFVQRDERLLAYCAESFFPTPHAALRAEAEYLRGYAADCLRLAELLEAEATRLERSYTPASPESR